MNISSAYINKSPLDNLDKSKANQLNSQQISVIQSLSVDQVKALNKQPFGQWKDLSSDSLRNYANKLQVDKLTSTEDQLKKIKDDRIKKIEQLRNANNPKDFLKSQSKVDIRATANALVAITLPLLTQFINAEKAANLVINKLINDSKKQLRNKGSFVVVNGAITFTPIDNANYQKYKDNFDRRVKTLKKIVKILKTIIDTLLRILRLVRIALTAFNLYLTITQVKLKTQSVAAAANTASPTGPYPAVGSYILSKEISQPIIDKIKEKIPKYIAIIDFILVILPILQSLINSLKKKLDQLSFTIVTNNQILPQESINSLTDEEPPSEVEYDSGDKTYIIKVITTLSGALQAVAYDKFSMLKITQTAPSKIRKADELIDELKQILG